MLNFAWNQPTTQMRLAWMLYWDISIVKVTRSLGAQFGYEAYWQTFSLGGL
jgi:hypothetical protein